MANKRNVGDVRGRYLIEIHHALEIIGRGVVEGGGGEVEPLGVCVVAKLAVFRLSEGVVFEEELVLAARGLLCGVPVCGGVPGYYRTSLVGLELGAVDSRFRGLVDIQF